MTDSLVSVEKGPVALLRIDNPPMNLISIEVTRQLDRAIAELESSDETRAVIVTGSGDRAFCVGSDVKEFESLRGRVGEGKLLLEKAVYRRLARLPSPTIAAINADALGGGLELALCCDFRVADEGARLGLPEVRLGVMPGSGGTQRLPRIVGEAIAKEMILTGEIMDAERAERIGLVSRVAPSGSVMDLANELADTIATRGPVAVREAKRAINLAFDVPLDQGLAAELDSSERIFSTDDMLEGAKAFFEKRKPDFRNR